VTFLARRLQFRQAQERRLLQTDERRQCLVVKQMGPLHDTGHALARLRTVGVAAGLCRNFHSVMTKSLDFALCSVRRLGQISQKREERIRLANEESHAPLGT